MTAQILLATTVNEQACGIYNAWLAQEFACRRSALGMLLQGIYQRRNIVRRQHHVRVECEVIFSTRDMDRLIVSDRETAILRVGDYLNVRKLFPNQIDRAILRGIIYHNELQ